MTMTLLVALAFGAAATNPSPSSTTAEYTMSTTTWEGTLELGHQSLHVVLHVASGSAPLRSVTLDSPDQGVTGLNVEDLRLERDAMSFRVPTIGAAFQGVVDPRERTASGTWSQGSARLPLILREVMTPSPVRRRVAEGRPPAPYDQREVTINLADANVTLAGTITLPRGTGPWPGVVLLSGSGVQDRDETILNHRPFFVIADHLARLGIAVLRFDDRGAGKSTGNSDTTLEERTSDALAAVHFLQSHPRICRSRVGVLGHSEGGVVAARVAARFRDIAFTVLLGTPAMKGEDLLITQSESLLRARGADALATKAARDLNVEIYRVVRESDDAAAASSHISAMLISAGLSKDDVVAQTHALVTRSFRSFLTQDPRSDLARVRVPMLAVWGERDLQVPARENAAAFRAAIGSAHDQEVTIRILPRLNHLLQTCDTGLPSEYASIRETIAPAALNLIAEWLMDRTVREPHE